MLRDHNPIVIKDFNGLWDRGDTDTVPLDHFTSCNNIKFGDGNFSTRDGVGTYRAKIASRMYVYQMASGESLLILSPDSSIYHVINETIIYGPILTIPEMTDFALEVINGIAYITPFKTETDSNGNPRQVGLANESIYVYKGDGNPARKAGGEKPVNGGRKPFIVVNNVNDGKIAKGIHWFSVTFNDGIRGPEVFPNIIAPGDKKATIFNIPIGPPGTIKRTITATKAINLEDYNPDQSQAQHYILLEINDNTTESAVIDFSDDELTVPYVEGAALPPVTQSLLAQNSLSSGFCDQGLHLFGVVYETDTGFLTAPGPENFAALTMVDITKRVDLFNIPVSPNNYVVKRHIISTKRINNYNGDQEGYQFFFVPEGEISNNLDTTASISFFDADLIDDSSYLIDNFTHPPAGVGLTIYHGRLCSWAEKDNIGVIRVSQSGEPEAFSQVDGLILVNPVDANPITNVVEYRDTLYAFKKSKTVAYNDNNDAPSSWQQVDIDNGIGCSVHGIATILDSGGVNVDFILVTDISGIMIFNGAYIRPELTWKIRNYWRSLDINQFNRMQIFNDSINQRIYINLPSNTILFGDYSNGLDYKSIRWSPWTFDFSCDTIAIVETDTLLIGAV